MKHTLVTILLVATGLAQAAAQVVRSQSDEAGQPAPLPVEGGRPVVDAQQTQSAVKVGYFSRSETLRQLPGYAAAEADIAKLKAQYDTELSEAEKDFTERFELFLDQQATLDETIRVKRQGDLQTLYDSNVKFRYEAARLLEKAHKEAFAPLETALDAAIAEVGGADGYLMIVDTDSHSCPFLDPARSEDVTAKILAAVIASSVTEKK